jgi:hypothetical protein
MSFLFSLLKILSLAVVILRHLGVNKDFAEKQVFSGFKVNFRYLKSSIIRTSEGIVKRVLNSNGLKIKGHTDTSNNKTNV